MSKGYEVIEGIPITFAVTVFGNAVVVEVPEERKDWFDGPWLDDNFENPPEGLKPGLYRGTFSFEFQQGYYEGYPADGESSTFLTLEKYEKV